MYQYILPTIGALALAAASAGAQDQRRASISGDGSPAAGRCTVEVVVDGAAEVEINGDNATLRNLSGQPPQWRRFDCTGRMSGSPDAFRLVSVYGRGRQALVRDPRNGGPAVIRIEDSQGGPDRYTFDVVWTSDLGGRPGGGVQTESAMHMCRDQIRQHAEDRFGTRNLEFLGMRMDNTLDRRVIGTVAPVGYGRRDRHDFTCSISNTGRVNWARIESPGVGYAGRFSPTMAAIENCRTEVEAQLRLRGLRNIDFGSVDADTRLSERVTGSARGDRNGVRREAYDFSCRVDEDDGDVKSVDLIRR